MEKNGFAQILDKIVEALGNKNGGGIKSDVLNMLPKPDTQEVGDGVIVWRWSLVGGVVVESVLTTRNNNQLNMAKDTYLVSVQMPESDNFSYTLEGDTSKDIGQAILSAWNWKNVWKLHAGDFLLDVLSKEPIERFDGPMPEPTIMEPEVIEPEIVDDESYPLNGIRG